jgi:hypothetical protein
MPQDTRATHLLMPMSNISHEEAKWSLTERLIAQDLIKDLHNKIHK